MTLILKTFFWVRAINSINKTPGSPDSQRFCSSFFISFQAAKQIRVKA